MSTKKITVAIDAMGGDYAPLEIVKGGILAARDLDLKIILTGKEVEIKKIIDDEEAGSLDVEIVDAPEDIPMEEKNPARAIRKAPNSSVVVANRLVKEGKADAVIAAGNTGAATAASLFTLGRLEGFDRPCICTLLPTHSSRMILIDAGSNIDSSPEQILQTGILGSILAKVILKGENSSSIIMKEATAFAGRDNGFEPNIGLLNIGGEEGKGTETYKQAYELLKQESRINFIGNVEGKSMINGGVDVALCDGFTGNIHLKALEGGLIMMSKSFERELKQRGPLEMIAGILLKTTGAINRIKDHFDPSSYGGALLGGLNHISLISHGSSSAEAIKNAAKHARVLVVEDVINKLNSSLRAT